MKWDLEERSEDAVVAYLKSVLPGDVRAYAAWEEDEPQYPCVVVHFGESEPISEDAEHHDPMMLGGEVAVMTEAANEIDSSGNVLRTARELNRDARSAVMDALAISDLLDKLIEQGVEDVAFSMAQLLPGRTRTTEGRVLVTTMPIGVIAEPVTGS